MDLLFQFVRPKMQSISKEALGKDGITNSELDEILLNQNLSVTTLQSNKIEARQFKVEFKNFCSYFFELFIISNLSFLF